MVLMTTKLGIIMPLNKNAPFVRTYSVSSSEDYDFM